MRILVVDDDEAGRLLASTMVRSAGHEAIEAENGVRALEVARTSPPDVIISDILMPRMDGYQLAREWKADPLLSSIPLIFLTASYTDPADERFALELGADGFLSKPVDIHMLLETINRVAGVDAVAEVRMPASRTEEETLRDYSERVVHKLEQKLLELERTNDMLESAMHTLSDELEAKRRLIDDLSAEAEARSLRESELREERDFNRSIIETADVFIIATDLECAITLFSAGAEAISGYSAADVLGRDAMQLFAPPNDIERRRSIEMALMSTSEATRITNPWVMNRGEERILEWTMTVTHDEHGEVSGIVRYGIDVTQRVVANTVERVMGVIDYALLLDRPLPDVLELACAQAADEFRLGTAWVGLFDEAGSLSVRAGVGPATEQFVAAFGHLAGATDLMAELRESAKPLHLTREAPGAGASWVAASADAGLNAVVLIPIRRHGGVVGVLGAMGYSAYSFGAGRLHALEMIADRLGVAMLFAEARGQLKLQSAALESSANAIVITSRAGIVAWVNPAFTRLTGFEPDQVVGSDILSETSAYREPAYTAGWERVMLGESWRDEVKNVDRYGAEYIEDVTISPVVDEAGLITHAVIVKQDQSERHRLEQLKSDFVAMVSHELRTPLTTIIGYGDLLSANAALPTDRVKAAVETIKTSGRRMQGIIEELLEVTQMQAEGFGIERNSVDVAAMVVGLAQAATAGVPHSLVLDVPADTPHVSLDQRAISHAIGNLLDNAVKYSPDGGAIGVSVRRAAGAVSIAVSDEGIGISEAAISGLFEAFQQGDMSSTRTYGGVGLGLFVANRLVKAHGGSIEVDSEEGVGSTFTVHLPVAAD